MSKKFLICLSTLSYLTWCWLLLAVCVSVRAAEDSDGEAFSYDAQQVGDEVEGRIVVPTNQVLSPLGQQVAFSGRPTDVALSPNGR